MDCSMGKVELYNYAVSNILHPGLISTLGMLFRELCGKFAHDNYNPKLQIKDISRTSFLYNIWQITTHCSSKLLVNFKGYL